MYALRIDIARSASRKAGISYHEIFEPVRGRLEDGDCYLEPRQVLLIGEITIGGEEYVELSLSLLEQFAIT